MDASTLQDIAKMAPVLGDTLGACASSVEKLSVLTSGLIEKIKNTLDDINSLEADVTELKDKLLKCRSLLAKSQITASTLVKRMSKCVEYGHLNEEEKTKMCTLVEKAFIENDKCKELNSYINQLYRYLEQCKKCYETFAKYYKDAIDSCSDGRIDCEKKKKDAAKGESQMNAGRRAAVGAGVVAAVGGVAVAATVAGLFTFGIGAPIVLGVAGLASGGSIVGGVATSATAAVYLGRTAAKYEKVEKGFDSISNDFWSMKDIAEKTDLAMFGLNELVKSMQDDARNVESNVKEDVDYNSFEKVFNVLLEGIAEAKEKVSTQAETIRKSMQL